MVVRSATGPIETGSPDCPRKIPLPFTTKFEPMVPSSALAVKRVTLESKLVPTTKRLSCPNSLSELVACKETPDEVMDVTVKGLFWLLEEFRASPTARRFVLIGGDASPLAMRKLTERGWSIVLRAPFDGAPTYLATAQTP